MPVRRCQGELPGSHLPAAGLADVAVHHLPPAAPARTGRPQAGQQEGRACQEGQETQGEEE